jgi:ABC-2 type transport system permease protein
MLQIYKRFWQVNWAEHWQYRANLMMYVLYGLVSPVVYLAVWTSIARTNGSVSGLTANDFVTYYLTLLVVDQIIADISQYYLADKIQDGTLSNDLIRPIHPVLTQTLIATTAQKALSFVALAPVWVILVLLFRPDYSAVTLTSFLMTLPTVLLGSAIAFLLGVSVVCVAFWTTRVNAIIELYDALIVLFSGAFVPLQLMPPAIQAVARYLPFQLFRYAPIETLLNKLSPADLARNYVLSAIWLALALFIFTRVWRAGVKRFSAVGA